MSTFPNQKHNTPVIKLNQPDDNYKFQPLPKPSGEYPYHLCADKFLSTDSQELVFHMVGDTGGRLNPDFQKKVAAEMALQFGDASQQQGVPQFLYHLGDVVYHFGEAQHYDEQFFIPYGKYPAPIFAIAGNHDSDVNLNSEVPYQSLDAFEAVFCNAVSGNISFNSDQTWKSRTQPNIFWTLETPLANIIGLHTNVPKYGIVTPEQRDWFVEELRAADKQRPDKAIIVCLHHAPYSADFNHSSSLPMITFLEEAFAQSGVRPDIVFSGHVHNYQRFEKSYPDGKLLPFIVAGAGGFDELHALARIDQEAYSKEHPLLKDVVLMNYCDNQHGFLKITLNRQGVGLTLTGEYYTIPHQIDPEGHATLADKFTYTFGGK
jgi:predicted phosphodiesterase